MLFHLKITIQNMLHISGVEVLSLACLGKQGLLISDADVLFEKIKERKKKVQLFHQISQTLGY